MSEGMHATLVVANITAMLAFIAAMARLHTLKVEYTIGGRAAQGMLLALLMLSGVGLLRRMDASWWPEAQAVAWFVAAGAAMGLAFTRTREHEKECS